jgi:DNA-binding transcriptional LysR family regulator
MGFLARCGARFENELALEAVGEIGLAAALTPEHSLRTLRKLPLQKVANERFVVSTRSSARATRDWIRDLCRANGFEPKMCDQAQAVLDSIAGGLGASILPEFFQRCRGEVVFRPLAPDAPRIKLCMVWRRCDNSEALHALSAILRQNIQEKSRKHAMMES